MLPCVDLALPQYFRTMWVARLPFFDSPNIKAPLMRGSKDCFGSRKTTLLPKEMHNLYKKRYLKFHKRLRLIWLL
jgi:hypothetical protein